MKADKEGLKLITTKAEQFNPNIVIIELGTNDLAIKAIDEMDQVNQILHYLFYICVQFLVLGVQKIILCEIVDCIILCNNRTQAEFNQKQEKFKSLLHSLPKNKFKHPHMEAQEEQALKPEGL